MGCQGEKEFMELIADYDNFMVEWVTSCQVAVFVGNFHH